MINKNKIKTLFILPNLAAGGAERVYSFVPQNMDPSRFQSTILIVGHKKDTVYDTGNIPVISLQKNRLKEGILAIYKFLKKERPDVVFGSIAHINTALGLMALFFPKIKFIIREASVISFMAKFSEGKPSLFWNIAPKIAYKQVDAVICQSKDMALDFHELYKIPLSKIVQIGNPITNLTDRVNQVVIFEQSVNKFITVGRLSKEKGHKRILELLANFKQDFTYTIVGDGPEKAAILTQISNLGLEGKVTYISHSNNVSSLLLENSLFLQGSYVEGFPNAVLESCTVGTPVLAFNVPGGTKEIIEHDINGYLVNNKEEFLEQLNKKKTWDRKLISQSVTKKYSPEIIISEYENLILNLVTK